MGFTCPRSLIEKNEAIGIGLRSLDVIVIVRQATANTTKVWIVLLQRVLCHRQFGMCFDTPDVRARRVLFIEAHRPFSKFSQPRCHVWRDNARTARCMRGKWLSEGKTKSVLSLSFGAFVGRRECCGCCPIGETCTPDAS